MAVLVGQPDDPQWRDTVDTAAGVMREVEELGANAGVFTVKTYATGGGNFSPYPLAFPLEVARPYVLMPVPGFLAFN